MKLLDYNASGATIHLDGKELIAMMALIQEGRMSFECESITGKALDELVSRAVASVCMAHAKEQHGLPGELKGSTSRNISMTHLS